MLLLDDAIFFNNRKVPDLRVLRVVLTRFTIIKPSFEQYSWASADNFKDYLHKRLPLFQSICLPSVAGQTRRPDRWLIGFDAARREPVEPILDLLAPHDWIVPVWQETVNGKAVPERRAFLNGIAQFVEPEHDWVLTTRLDNDDALHLSHCEAMARYAAAAATSEPSLDDFWITFPHGAQLEGSDAFVQMRTNSPFLSRCERADRFRQGGGWTSLQGNHSRVHQENGRVFLPSTSSPMWLQCIHESNLANRMRPESIAVLHPEELLARFGLKALGAARPPWSSSRS